jgi:hypothetical protein
LRFILVLSMVFGVLSSPLLADEISPPRPDLDKFVVNNASVRQVARVLGFVAGQTAALNAVARQHPHLAARVEALQREFVVSYSFPGQRARWFLDYALGEEVAAQQANRILDQVQASVGEIDATRALMFLSEVEGRLDGQVSVEELKIMLWLAHPDDGDLEMRTWWEGFNSASHPKAAGLEITLRTPLSWEQMEGNRPHIVSKWTSQNGTGDVVVTLLVRMVPEVITYDDVREVARSGDWGWMIPEGFEFLNGAPVEIDRQPGLQVDAIGERRALDAVITQRTRTYTLFPPNRLVQLGCALGAAEGGNEAFLDRRFEAMRQTCRQIAASIAFPDTYR